MYRYMYYFNPCDLKVCVSDKDLPTGKVQRKPPPSSHDACELTLHHAIANHSKLYFSAAYYVLSLFHY